MTVSAVSPLSGDPRAGAGGPLSAFVGRDAALSDLERRAQQARLVSLVGPGGSGKSRLARALCERLTAAGGALRPWWVPLSQIDRPSLVASTVAEALQVAEMPGRSAPAALVTHLRAHPAWLVWDNCEHLVDACARLAVELLRACPELRLITTSREPLAVTGETIWWVNGLSLPADTSAPTADEISASEAVRLFVDRARLVQPQFTVTDANAASVARLCHQLDGMPLALELAAARLRVLPLPRVVERLDDAVPLLATTNRDVPARQATLRATLDWSYDLLTTAEREVFERLSVFRGGFDLAAVDAVATGGVDALDVLARLVDKSLVQVRNDGVEERYRLLEVVRQYAGERLGDGRAAVAARHAAHLLTVAERAEQGLIGNDEPLWLDRLQREQDNMRAALSWARTADPGLGLRLAGALGRYWRFRGQYTEGREWLSGAVSGMHPDTPAAVQAKALSALGLLEYLQCDYGPAEVRLRRAVRLHTAVDDTRGVALARQSLASIAREQGRYAEAHEHHLAALALWRTLDEPVEVANAMKSVSFTAWLEGDHDRAIELATEALRRFRELGDAKGTVVTLIGLGAATYRRGDPVAARSLLQECLTLAGPLGLREETAWAREQLGLVAAHLGERETAAALLRESLAVHHELGDRWRTASVLDALAGVIVDARTGARLLAVADTVRREIGTPVPPADRADHDRRVAAVRAAVSPDEARRARTQGMALSVQQAVAVALDAAAVTLPVAPARQPVTAVEEGGGLQVYALGRTRVMVDGRVLGPEDWTYAKPRELLFHLLSAPDASKAAIGLALWPEASGTELRNSFHTCLKYLRRAVGTDRVRFSGGVYRVDTAAPFGYDVAEFRAAVAAVDDHPGVAARIGALTAAATRYRGDFLADVPAGAWADRHREDLRRRFEHTLLNLGTLLGRERRFAEAGEAFARLVAYDPLLEAAHRGLMRCHAALGNRGRAVHQYHELVRLLDTQVGAPPAAETTELYLRLRRDHPAGVVAA